MKQRKTLHIVTRKELESAQASRYGIWGIVGLLITFIAGILLAIYSESVIYSYLTIVVYIVYGVIMVGILERFGKIEKIIKRLEIRNTYNQKRKQAVIENNKKNKTKKTSKNKETAYLKHKYTSFKNPDMYDIDWDDFYEYLDNRDKETYEPKYKPSVTEWLGGYLIASKTFDKLFKSNDKNKEY